MELSEFLIGRITIMKGNCREAVSLAEEGDAEGARMQLARAKLESDTVYQALVFPYVARGEASKIPEQAKKLIEEVNAIYAQSFEEARRSYETHEKNILN